MPHELETLFNAPANDIMDAILKGFRAQVDVKGKLAELYLHKYLVALNDTRIISDLIWEDQDGVPDFKFNYRNKAYVVECKNLRNEIYKKPRTSYKVEIQKTRNSKDGTNTRSYRVDYFDILAACMFNQTGEWKFIFIRSQDLEVVPENPSLLKIMQRVPTEIKDPWKSDLIDLLNYS
ncbi:MAG: hypothetical protein EHM14_15195 [Methanothrix sp.]|nr:MAG: hypothetical protein EHM14_15195 [Methanothrix sp.]